MEYRRLGTTNLQVSAICLGTMTWGQQNTEREAHAQLDYALDSGINFIDTAEMYPVACRAETYGRTEAFIGNWLAERGNRDKVILASKVVGRSDWLPHIRDGQACLDRKNIQTALEASLRRLRSDYLDLYQLHWPDRATNFFGQLGYQHSTGGRGVPIEHTLDALDALVSSGKVRHVGISNETPWGTMRYLAISGDNQLPRIASIQNPYSLLNRTFEIGLAEISQRENIGLLAYSPLGFGVLTGKYLDGRKPPDGRLTLFEQYTRYSNPQADAATRAYVQIARNHGLDPAQMALAYVNSRSFVTSTIIGATTMEQLRTNIASIDIKLAENLLEDIEAIHTRYPNPCP